MDIRQCISMAPLRDRRWRPGVYCAVIRSTPGAMTPFDRSTIFSMRKKILLVAVSLLAVVLLSGCTGSTTWFGLSTSGDVAYLANNTAVHAIDVKTGAELWNFSGEASSGFSLGRSPKLFDVNPIVTDDGLVIIASSGNDHTMYEVNPKDIPDP